MPENHQFSFRESLEGLGTDRRLKFPVQILSDFLLGCSRIFRQVAGNGMCYKGSRNGCPSIQAGVALVSDRQGSKARGIKCDKTAVIGIFPSLAVEIQGSYPDDRLTIPFVLA